MVVPQAIKRNDQATVLPELAPQPFKWSTVSLTEVLGAGGRLEASVFNIEGRQARETLHRCKWPVKSLLKDFLTSAYYPGRFKRSYIKNNDSGAVGFIGSSEMLAINPEPVKFMVHNHELAVSEGQILLSRSGTIGNVTYISKTLSNFLVSEHAIRLNCKDKPGYVYAYLRTHTGRLLVETNTYGAVVSQVEPEHLTEVHIPDPSPILKQQIHDFIMASFRLRDESNALMNEAQKLLKAALKLPDIDDIKPKYFDSSADLRNYSVSLSCLDGRLEASYHLPIVDSIQRLLAANAKEVVTVGDSRVSKAIILPGRFKRVYVEEGQGVTFFGGKQILELDPSTKKYLSSKQHGKRITEQLTILENTILVTRSGTIGKINIAPKHWKGWIPNEHIIRVIPANASIAGYTYAWLASDYAYPLIHRFTYGAVVDEIDDFHVAAVPFPFLQDTNIQKTINDKVLEANRKRFEAYELEQKALKIMDEKVIFAEGAGAYNDKSPMP
ncbi:MAG: restriction endonuclease subunit S [Deltaproteobacteria bacterium]|nr:restriction endonuclease subunit S [Deltaproteobacteria bacterium]